MYRFACGDRYTGKHTLLIWYIEWKSLDIFSITYIKHINKQININMKIHALITNDLTRMREKHVFMYCIITFNNFFHIYISHLPLIVFVSHLHFTFTINSFFFFTFTFHIYFVNYFSSHLHFTFTFNNFLQYLHFTFTINIFFLHICISHLPLKISFTFPFSVFFPQFTC